MKRLRTVNLVVSYLGDNAEPLGGTAFLLEAEGRDTTRAEELTGMIGEGHFKVFGVMVLSCEDDHVFLPATNEELPVLLRNETQVTGAQVMGRWTRAVWETRVKSGLGEGNLFLK